MPEAIPHEHRYAELRSKLDFFANALRAVIAPIPSYDMRHGKLFFELVRPWLLPPNADQALRQAVEPAKEVANRAGFPAQELAADILLIFDNDKHLRECCGEPLALAYALDDLYVHPAAELLLKGEPDKLPKLFGNFENLVYGEGPYTRIAYSHIFNFSSKADRLDFGPLTIRRLTGQEVALILGGPTMPTQYTFLQPPQVGTCFIVQEANGRDENLFDWLWNSHVRAIELFRVIQYHKSGVAYIDYSTLHFKPDWVNRFRKFGLFYVGNPRRLPYLNGAKLFEVSEADCPAINRKVAAYLSPEFLALMGNEQVPFRQGSLRAGDYYEASLAEERPAGRLIALAVALESLFSSDDKQEISFKIALTASNLLGDSAERRAQIFDDLRSFYDLRSKIVHGSYDVKKMYEGSFVTHDDIDRWSEYLREGVLRFLTMYFRGKRTKPELDSFRRELLMCALDNGRADALRKMSDLDVYLDEKFPR